MICLQSKFNVYRWVKRELSLPLFKDVISPIVGLLIFSPCINWRDIGYIIENKGRRAAIFGAGPTLMEGVRIFLDKYVGKYCILCADGAVKALLEHNIIPDIVVTDLDGDPRALLRAYRLGSKFIILCHGDNIDKQLFYRNRIRRAYLTSQVYSIPPLIRNFDGFTDGDRALYIAASLGAKDILLIGMDFGSIIGKYSLGFKKNLSKKIIKLRIGKILVDRAILKFDLKVKKLGN